MNAAQYTARTLWWIGAPIILMTCLVAPRQSIIYVGFVIALFISAIFGGV